jgi:hypothetical protein
MVGADHLWKKIYAFQAEAVKRGAAYWKVDQETGDTEFTWNDEKDLK